MTRVFAIFLTLGLFLTGGVFAQKRAVDPELARLRHEWAMRYLEPGPHMELAKYFRKKGNLIQAFYILEAARRYRFDPKTFDDAFLLHFGGFAPLDNSPAEEAKYIALLKSSPDDVKLLAHLADIYISRSDYVRGEPLLRSAYEKDPQNDRTLLAIEELYKRLGTPEKGELLVKEFERKYPDSVGGYVFRLSRIKSDPNTEKQLLAEAIAKYPDEGYFWFLRGAHAMEAKDLDAAETSFVKATTLDKNSKTYHAAAASFFRVERKNFKRAVEHYLNVYFLDPHAHFDGHAEAKVAGLNADIAESAVDAAVTNGRKAEQLLDDPNPAIVGYALTKMLEKWDSSKTDAVIGLMRHDDVLVRWTAMLAITEKEGRKLDARVRELLKDEDLRVRGLAAYMAVRLWKEGSFPEMKKLLKEDAQVLRFDAVSALLMEGGGGGKKIVAEHKLQEPNESLKKLIEVSLAKTPKDE